MALMAIVNRRRKTLADGTEKTYRYVSLRESKWLSEVGATKVDHICSLGPEPVPQDRIEKAAFEHRLDQADIIQALRHKGIEIAYGS